MIKGLGCDIVEHRRVNLKIAPKVLSAAEMMLFHDTNNQIQYLASRFAAKEAIIKATNKQYLMQDIEIYNTTDGQPQCNIKNICLTISHEQNYSMAVAIWEE